jgi:hypothetical protein
MTSSEFPANDPRGSGATWDASGNRGNNPTDGENRAPPLYSTRTALNRSALAMTLTDDRAIAAAASIGESSRPVTG